MKNMPEVDVVIVGLGWTGGILGKELTESGLKVVALERGAYRTPEEAFSVPHIRDELKYSVRTSLMIDTKTDTLSVRNNASQTALPMRRLGSFLPGTDVGGAGSHWNGHTWRWTDSDLQVRSMYEQRYGKAYIPEDMTIQDWGITYKELEPYYDKFEKVAGISGTAGKVGGKTVAGGNPFEGDRSSPYPMPALKISHAGEVFRDAATKMGYNPFPTPAANASQPYTNPDGSVLGQCQYCGYCERYGCESNAKGSPNITVIPLALKQKSFEMRTHSWVTKVVTDDAKKRATGVEYTNLNNGERCFQPAAIVILAAYGLNNVHLMLLSQIGEVYDPATGKGLIGKNYAYQTGAGAQLFFEEGHLFNPFMSTGSLAIALDDFHQNWDFDRSKAGNFVGGYTISSGMFHGRPIEYHPVPPGTPRWGKGWKEAMARWYNRSMSVGSSGSVMASRNNFLDLDPTYRNALGLPLMRMTFDYQKNEHAISTHAAQTIDKIAKSLNPTIVTRPAPRTGPWSVVPYQSTHNTGGTIMGADPGKSVVNKYGQVWQVPNLFITGASVFPHNSAYNPTGPVGALAYYTSDAIRNKYIKQQAGTLIAA